MSIRIFRRLSWLLMAIIAIGVAMYFATPYLLFNPALSRLRLNPAIPLHFPILAIHGIIAGTALLIGPFQFLTPLRAKYPSVHRLIGRIYIVCVFIASIGAFFSASSRSLASLPRLASLHSISSGSIAFVKRIERFAGDKYLCIVFG